VSDKVLYHSVLAAVLAAFFVASPAHARRGAPAELDIRNGWDEPVSVHVDGAFVQRLDPGEPLELRLRPGRHELRVVDRRGRTIEQLTAELAPHSERAVLIQAPVGELRIDSAAQVPLSVTIQPRGDRRGPARHLELGPGKRRALTLEAGTYELTVEAAWFGQTVVVSQQRVEVRAEDRERLRLQDPREALVQVRSSAPVDAEVVLFLGQRSHVLGTVPAGGTALLPAPVGTARLGLVVDGVLLDQQQVRVDARSGGRFQPRVALGRVELENHGRDALVLYVDGIRQGEAASGRELERTVLAGERSLRVVDALGRVVVDQRVWIDVGEELELELGRHSRSRSDHRRRGDHRHSVVRVN
jgi:hypothetical protein